jgi:coenzyme F420-reducing hydrogenase beta subunit
MTQIGGNVCAATVAHDLCIGCGACAGVCPSRNLAMQWTPDGQWTPVDSGKCRPQCRVCMDVCPFLDRDENEDTLATRQYGAIDGIRHVPETGYYLAAYVGHANDGYRERGASGGVTSWLLAALLQQGAVDRVICVRPGADPQRLFEYATLSSPGEVRAAARSAYYPVEMSDVLRRIAREDNRCAVVTLPCLAKALRLACARNQRLANRITHVLGLVCGQTKSRLFAEYCAAASGGNPGDLAAIEFRKKFPADLSKCSYECAFCHDGRIERRPVLGWERGMGKAWGNSAFTPRACLFCDDVFAETADCAMMDAWLPEYGAEWLGTSLILVRSPALRRILLEGAASGALHLKDISLGRVIESQRPVLVNKRNDVWLRLRHDQRRGRPVPGKRKHLLSPPSWFRRPRIIQRMQIQRRSPALWRDRGGLAEFVEYLAGLELWPSRIEELGTRWTRLRQAVSSCLCPSNSYRVG